MISLILTVLNEGDGLRPLLDSLVTQTCAPDEIIVVDGGSRDATVALLNEYSARLPLRVVVEAGANISQGRNRAIREAAGTVIAVTDAGVYLSADWLEAISAPFAAAAPPDVVSGFFQADPHSAFEAALGAATLPLVTEIDPASFLPSSRSIAFRKTAWEQAGGYPEWLDYGEDLVFDLRLKADGLKFAFAPRALAYFRPRPTPRAFATQYFRYARGDGKADLWRKRHAIRYATYLAALPLLLWLISQRRTRGLGLLGLIMSAASYLGRAYLRLPAVLTEAEHVSPDAITWVRVLAWLPALRVLGDFAKMLGYPVGWAWRLRERPPGWRG